MFICQAKYKQMFLYGVIMSFGSRLKEVRKHFNLTQKDCASKLKITQVSVINYEKNNRFPDSRLLTLIHKSFKIDMTWLLAGEGCMFGDREQENVTNVTAYKMGDIVELISGSKPMTIIQADPKEVTCAWPNANDDLQTATFPVGAVKRIKEK